MKHIAAGHSVLRNRSLLRNQHNMDLSLLQGINYIELIQPASTRAVVAVSILHRNAECECLSCCGLGFVFGVWLEFRETVQIFPHFSLPDKTPLAQNSLTL